MFDFILSNPATTISTLLAIVGAIDYIAGSTPTKKDDKYVGITRRILHKLKKLISRKGK